LKLLPSPPRRARALSGFTSTLPSPFHFGGVVPQPSCHQGAVSCPPQSQAVGGGLPALAVPNVVGSKGQWLQAIDKLARASGADRSLLGRVRSWIDEGGVRCRFLRPPPQANYANTFTFRKHEGECLERMQVYQDMGALRKLAGLPPAGAHVQPLHAVVRPGKKARVCVDLSRGFNEFLKDEPFSMTTMQDAVDLSLQTETPAWYVKLDISACFLSFPIHPADQKFFYCEAGGDFYQFLTLVFGRKDAPFVATVLLDVVSAAMVDAGIMHVRYLDDFLIVATTATRAWACAHQAAAYSAALASLSPSRRWKVRLPVSNSWG